MNGPEINIRPMDDDEFTLWGALRTKLWPDCLESENLLEYEAFANGTSAVRVVFLAFYEDTAIGFAEIGERSVADGCVPGPVAYLEGWYVEPEFRRFGIGGKLIAASARWATENAYSWFASDVELDNVISQQAHSALGFEESGRAINYRLKLTK